MTTLDPAPPTCPTLSPAAPAQPGIPLSRIVTTELRKMFDTRSGFWLMASIGILALLATAAVIAFSSDDRPDLHLIRHRGVLPDDGCPAVIAILSVTSEWSQRSGLTTFTLVPHRGRVVAAKAIASVTVAVATSRSRSPIGAVGNIVGATSRASTRSGT